MSLASDILEGNRLALARLITQVENDTPEGRAGLDELFPHTGRAHLIGVTGAPGTGKSSLVSQLARQFRLPAEENTSVYQRPCRTAIIAVDPSSPFSGGSILGDRVRMRDLAGDTGVFIRSMASRGSLGGLAAATAGVTQVLDAAGYEVILIETVGAGQAEVDIARLAHTTLVIEAPGLGDDIQAIKAGILEIADILVVNKADLPGAEAAERALQGMLQLAQPTRREFLHHRGLFEGGSPVEILSQTASDWSVPICLTVAREGKGISLLMDAIAEHFRYLHTSGEWEKRERIRLTSDLDWMLREALFARWRQSIPDGVFESIVKGLNSRQYSPGRAVEGLLKGEVQ